MESRLLTKNQERHLQVCFSSLLNEAEELRDWARSSQAGAENPWAQELIVQLEHLMLLLHAAAERLSLDVDVRKASPERRVTSWASTWWAQILDCRPQALRGYGHVEPELERELAPVVDEIAASLLRVGSLVSDGSHERGEISD